MNNALSTCIVQFLKLPVCLVEWLSGERWGPDCTTAWEGASTPGWLGVLGHFTKTLLKKTKQQSPGQMTAKAKTPTLCKKHRTFVLRVKTVSLTVGRSLVGIYFSRILSKSGWDDRDSSIRRPKYLWVVRSHLDTKSHSLSGVNSGFSVMMLSLAMQMSSP